MKECLKKWQLKEREEEKSREGDVTMVEQCKQTFFEKASVSLIFEFETVYSKGIPYRYVLELLQMVECSMGSFIVKVI